MNVFYNIITGDIRTDVMSYMNTVIWIWLVQSGCWEIQDMRQRIPNQLALIQWLNKSQSQLSNWVL